MMFIPKRPTKRERLAAIMAEIGDIPELPAEAEDTSNASAGNTCEPVTIREDGKLLTGDRWILPQDFATDEVARGELPSMKGCSPAELPMLDDQDEADQKQSLTPLQEVRGPKGRFGGVGRTYRGLGSPGPPNDGGGPTNLPN